jgi:S1-C subfamily serine protease
MAGLLATGQALAATTSGSLSGVFKTVAGAVVVVHTKERTVEHEPNGRMVAVAGSGSGVLVSRDGRIITAAHVVQAADKIAVEFQDGSVALARVVSSDPAADVALLKLENVPASAVFAKLGDSDKAEVGDQIFIVGAPLGMSHTLTAGHLSARRRVNATYGGMSATELFQTDAAINPGNSGGPMFNMRGEVIGIVSYIISRSGGSEGIGLVVTVNLAQKLLFEEPTVWSGLEGYLLSPQLSAAFNVPGAAAGLLIQRVAEDSPAERLGLRGGAIPATVENENLVLGGDIVLAVDGIRIGSPSAYELIRRRMIELLAAGDPVRVSILRDGEEVDLTTGGRRQ